MTAAVLPRGTIEDLALDLIDVGDNVRVNIAELEELTASIQAHGVLQPVKVVPAGDRFRLVWGQRRVLASRLAGLATIPAIVEASTSEGATRSIEQLVENLHRADLNPIDRAAAMRAVVDAGVSQADLARQLGIAPSTVTNDLSLLEAPERIRRALEQGEITPAHAKAMKGLAPKTQEGLLDRIIAGGYSAHETERQVQEERRRADWQREQQDRSEAAEKERLSAYMTEAARLGEGKTPKDAHLVVARGYAYDDRGRKANLARAERIANYLLSVGFVNVDASHAVAPKPKGADCNCTVLKVEDNNGRLSIAPGCIVEDHQRAKDRRADAERIRLYKLEEAVRAQLPKDVVAWAIPDGQGNGIGMNRILAEATLWNALEWRLGDWAKAIAGPKAKPWEVLRGLSDADLAKELAKAVVSEFRGKAGYKVGWDELARQLGVEAPTA